MVTTNCGREAMQRRERFQENVPRELGRGILTYSYSLSYCVLSGCRVLLMTQIADIVRPDAVSVSSRLGSLTPLLVFAARVRRVRWWKGMTDTCAERNTRMGSWLWKIWRRRWTLRFSRLCQNRRWLTVERGHSTLGLTLRGLRW